MYAIRRYYAPSLNPVSTPDNAKKIAAVAEDADAENAKRDGITVLASGLQYEVLTAGEGAKPSCEDTVRTHYHGTLIDGRITSYNVCYTKLLRTSSASP